MSNLTALACARIFTHELRGRRTHVAFESLASGHAWTDKLLVSGTVCGQTQVFLIFVSSLGSRLGTSSPVPRPSPLEREKQQGFSCMCRNPWEPGYGTRRSSHTLTKTASYCSNKRKLNHVEKQKNLKPQITSTGGHQLQGRVGTSSLPSNHR